MCTNALCQAWDPQTDGLANGYLGIDENGSFEVPNEKNEYLGMDHEHVEKSFNYTKYAMKFEDELNLGDVSPGFPDESRSFLRRYSHECSTYVTRDDQRPGY